MASPGGESRHHAANSQPAFAKPSGPDGEHGVHGLIQPIDSLYSPIKKWQTRLLRLHPGTESDILRADLLVADIIEVDHGLVLHKDQELTTYDAISYTWGDPIFSSDIFVNECRMSVTASLHGALHRFRFPDQARLLWADAVCIDQRNADEKSFQVQNMLRIFRKASCVLVWLGPLEEHEANMLEELRSFYAQYPTLANSQSPTALWELTERIKQTLTNGRFVDFLQGLIGLCCRTWIRQEVFVAASVIVFCGSAQMSLEEYRYAGRLLARLTKDENDPAKQMTEPESARCSALTRLRQAGPRELAELDVQRLVGHGGFCSKNDEPDLCTRPQCILLSAKDVLAGDVRDRVYALLGLTACRTSSLWSAHPDKREILQIDYNQTPSRVFQDLAKYIINLDRSLELIGLDEGTEEVEPIIDLPSWTPDWRLTRAHLLNGFWPKKFTSTRLDKLERQDPEDEGVLRFSCFFLARVSGTSKDEAELEHFYESLRAGDSLYRPSLWDLDGLRIGDFVVQAPRTRRLMVLRPRSGGGYYYVKRPCSRDQATGYAILERRFTDFTSDDLKDLDLTALRRMVKVVVY